MKAQPIENNIGLHGVFISMKDWEIIKAQYPDIEEVNNEIPDWQKEILTERLEAISKNPNRVKPIQGLLEVLNKRIAK